MANINLLPWREKVRAQRHRAFMSMLLIVSVFVVALIGYWYWYNLELIAYQKQRNHLLRTELKQVSQELQEIKRLEKMQQDLVARMQVVNNLQSSRPLSVRLFDELVDVLPEGVQITELTQTGNLITLAGRAESNARISALMRAIEISDWLEKPELLVIEQNKRSTESGINNFSLSMQQVGLLPQKVAQ